MSVIKATICDQCNTPAPAGHLPLLPRNGWLRVMARPGGLDFCSWACMASYAAAKVKAQPGPKRAVTRKAPVVGISSGKAG